MANLSETFGLRENWLKSLVRVLPDHPEIFNKANLDNAMYDLNINGTRQVPAIKEWCEGMGVIEKKDGGYYLTELGELFRQEDSLFEEYGTAWAMHYSLCINNQNPKSKLWFYNHYANSIGAGKFSRDDVKALYASSTNSESVLDNKIMSPLCETMRFWTFASILGIGNFPEKTPQNFDRRVPDVNQLHPAILAYMLYDWSQRNDRPGVNIAEYFSCNGVARLLALQEQQFCEYLQQIHDRYHKKILWVSFTAGLNSVTFEKNIPPLAILETYYLEYKLGLDPLEALQTALIKRQNKGH